MSTNESDAFFSGGPGARRVDADRDGHGRYVMTDRDGERRSWTRATTIAGAVEERYHLEQWERRLVAYGLGRRPDLVALAANATDPGDKAVLNDVLRQARESAAGDAGANMGTALHLAAMHVLGLMADGMPTLNEALAQVAEVFRDDVRAIVGCLVDAGLRPVPGMIERAVRCTALDAAGTFDVLCEFVSGPMIGERVVVDLKTERDPQEWGQTKIPIQLSIYNHADGVLDPETKRMEPMPAGIRTDFAIVLHLRPGSGQCLPYRVDTDAGWWAARLALELRAWRSGAMKPITPWIAPAAGLKAEVRWAPTDIPLNAAQESLDVYPPVYTSEPPAIEPAAVDEWERSEREASADEFFAAEHLTYEEADPAGVDYAAVQEAVETAAPAGTSDDARGLVPHADEQLKRLMKMSKGDLQAEAASLGVTDLKRQKDRLAAYVVMATTPGLVELNGFLLADAKIDADKVEQPEPPHPLTAHRLQLIRTATTVNEITALHNDVHAAEQAEQGDGSDPGWTPELDEAAKARYDELERAHSTKAPGPPYSTSSTDPAVQQQVEQGNAAARSVAEAAARTRCESSAPNPKELALRLVSSAPDFESLRTIYDQYTSQLGVMNWDDELAAALDARLRVVGAGNRTPVV
jgi:hypothetical protein